MTVNLDGWTLDEWKMARTLVIDQEQGKLYQCPICDMLTELGDWYWCECGYALEAME